MLKGMVLSYGVWEFDWSVHFKRKQNKTIFFLKFHPGFIFIEGKVGSVPFFLNFQKIFCFYIENVVFSVDFIFMV